MPEGTVGMMEGLYHALARRWPMMVAYSLAGAALLWAFSLVGDHPYRAAASVVVHHNVERAHPDANEREIAGYLNRETALLETVAYSDEVWQPVFEGLAQEGWLRTPNDGASLFDRTRLPHPMDGEWQFVASADDPALAARVANLWAGSFVGVVNEGVGMAIQSDALRARVWDQMLLLSDAQESCLHSDRIEAEIEAIRGTLAGGPADPAVREQLLRLAAGLGMACEMPGCEPGATDADVAALAEALAAAAGLDARTCASTVERLQGDLDRAVAAAREAASSLEVSPFLEVSLVREAQIPLSPYVATGWYVIVGGVLGMGLWLAREGMRRLRAGEARE